MLDFQEIDSTAKLDAKTLFDLVKLSFGVVAGAGALVALVVAYRRQRVDKAGAHRDATRLHTERFSPVVDKLGSESPAVRLGGVHALAGLADDAPDASLRQTCIDVLCAYLRLPFTSDPGSDPAHQEEHHRYLALRKVRHTILRFIADHYRRPRGTHRSWQGCDLDLRGVTIDTDMDFTDATFSEGTVSFERAAFSGAEVSFMGATFSGARVHFDDATFSDGVVLFTAVKLSEGLLSFRHAVFSGGRMFFESVLFSGGTASFIHATFSKSLVRWTRAMFSGGTTSFEHATFSGATMSFDGSGFTGGTMSSKYATFSGSTMSFEVATFSGGSVSFERTEFTAGTMSFREAQGGPAPAGLVNAHTTGSAQVLIPSAWLPALESAAVLPWESGT
ncbi:MULTISPECIES: pentapeptide repeat-containing protein [Streptomyces]|uniref:pentapeptide repeat-containing protein n=1 Tax=Streptomyces TaxID=1883 RepID=UPI00278C0733|nr:pentapeptide repeat-containing protein [Streptomyces hydrogenans]